MDSKREALPDSLIRKLPKAELHLHLEGCVTPAILLELSRKYRTEYESLGEEGVRKALYRYEDFYSFLDTYRVVCSHLREPEDYLALLGHLSGCLQEENIRYAEVIFSPAVAWKQERDGEEILAALLERSRQAGERQGTIIRWILDCVRQFGPESARRTAELAVKFQEQGVVAIGLGGDENSLPMEEYREVFSWTRAHRLHAHVHAGEIGDATQIWEALQVLGAKRIGHGIQAARDPKLMEYLRQRAVALDICLTSNLRTGAWKPISDNPFRLLFKRGVPVTLNTDDPGLFETSLTEELGKAVKHFQLTREDVNRLILQSLHSSFLPRPEKMAMMELFQKELQDLS